MSASLSKIFPQIKSCIRNKIKNRQYFYTQNDVSIFHKPEILNHVTNTSDHLAITIQFEYKIDESIRNNHEKTEFLRITPDFENPIIFNIYNQYIEEELVGLDSILLNLNKNNTTNNQMQTDEFYSRLCKVFMASLNKTLQFSKNNEFHNRLNNHGQKILDKNALKLKLN